MSGNFHANQNTQMTANNPIVKADSKQFKNSRKQGQEKTTNHLLHEIFFKVNWKMWPGLYLAPTR